MQPKRLYEIGFRIFVAELTQRGVPRGIELHEYIRELVEKTGVPISEMREFLRLVNLRIQADKEMSMKK